MGGHLAVDPADRVRTRRTEWLSGRRLFLLPMNLKKPGCTALQRAFQRCLGGVMTSTLLAASREIPAVDIDLDGLSSSDVQLFQGSMSAGINAGDTWIRAEVNGGWFGVDYRPVDFDLFGSAVRIEEPRIGAGIRSSHAVGDRWTLLTDASAYDGFQSYRSAWVSQWYSQFFNGLPGLKEADPAGMAGGIGIRHELIRTRLWVQLEAGLALDRIAPGYTEILDENESLVDVRPLRSHLATQSYRLSLENAVTPWLKTRVAVRVADQVERRRRSTLETGSGSLPQAHEPRVFGTSAQLEVENAGALRQRRVWGPMAEVVGDLDPEIRRCGGVQFDAEAARRCRASGRDPQVG